MIKTISGIYKSNFIEVAFWVWYNAFNNTSSEGEFYASQISFFYRFNIVIVHFICISTRKT